MGLAAEEAVVDAVDQAEFSRLARSCREGRQTWFLSHKDQTSCLAARMDFVCACSAKKYTGNFVGAEAHRSLDPLE